MAGTVRLDQFNPPFRGRMELMPRTCPVTMRFGEVCMRYDTHSGGSAFCPFLYGLQVVVDDRHHAEGRSCHEMRDLAAASEMYSTRQWTALCLQAPPDHVQPGIHP